MHPNPPRRAQVLCLSIKVLWGPSTGQTGRGGEEKTAGGGGVMGVGDTIRLQPLVLGAAGLFAVGYS